jgi:hypothetical protein
VHLVDEFLEDGSGIVEAALALEDVCFAKCIRPAQDWVVASFCFQSSQQLRRTAVEPLRHRNQSLPISTDRLGIGTHRVGRS